MKNHWTSFFRGHVVVKITGKLIEQFLNHCVRENIFIWNVKRHGEQTVSFHLHVQDIKKIRLLIRQYDCKLTFTKREGLPFLLTRLWKNNGILFGITACIILIILLSNMVWNISIAGANPKLQHEIELELKQLGIMPGKFIFLLPAVDEIQQHLTDQIEMITWVGVERIGTTYRLQVVEKSMPEEPELLNPRHLVAKKKGVIYDYFVEKGAPLISVNQFVEKGDILVSGIIGKEDNTDIVAAKGKVYAEIWYKSHVVVPLETTFSVFTGNHYVKRALEIGNISIPIWGFRPPEFAKQKEEIRKTTLRFFKWDLPISYVENMIRETESATRTYDEKTALKVAKQLALIKLKEQLPEGSTIKGENILHERIENGKVKLMIHFKVIEDIAKEQPIIQGD